MSSTDRTPITYAAPSTVVPRELQSPEAAEAWYLSLPPEARAVFQNQVSRILIALPPATRNNLGRALVSRGYKVPAELGVSGLGSLGDDGGGYGAAIGTLIGAGAGFFTAQQANQTALSMNNSTNAANANIAAINAAGQVAINQAFADAQSTAAAYKAQTTVSIAPTIAKWSAIGAVGVATVGFGIWFAMRRRKK